jgi:hypothetical protein
VKPEARARKRWSCTHTLGLPIQKKNVATCHSARSGVGLVQRWQCGGGCHHADELGRRGLAVGVRGGRAGTGDGQTTTWRVGRGPILYKRLPNPTEFNVEC